MKKYFTAISIALSIAASASEPWNMKQCMSYAATHASSVVQARWDVAGSTALRDEALADFFPSVSAQVGSQFSWGRNIDPETNTYSNITNFNNGYGLYASITVFDGGQTLNRYRRARNERERYLNNLEMKCDDSAISAMMAFSDVFYYQHSLRIAEEQLIHSENMLTLTRIQEELGMKGKPDVAQAEATVANDRYSLLHQQNNLEQAKLSLLSALNMPVGSTIEIDTTFTCTPTICPEESTESIYNTALSINPKLLEVQNELTSSKLSYDIAKGNLMPTISLNAGVSTAYYKTLSSDYRTPSFSDQFINNRGEYISATLSIPIFDGLNRLTSKKRAKYAYEQSKEKYRERQRQLHDEIASAVMDRDGYAKEIMALNAKVEADKESYRLNIRKYEEGLLSLIDLQLSANTYFSSRVELLRKHMLYILKDKLIDYYKGHKLWM